jgi:hypothetical protein
VIGSIEVDSPQIVAQAPHVLDQALITVPPFEVHNILDNDPPWLERSRKPGHIESCALARFFLGTISACTRVVGALRRRQDEVDWTYVTDDAGARSLCQFRCGKLRCRWEISLKGFDCEVPRVYATDNLGARSLGSPAAAPTTAEEV